MQIIAHANNFLVNILFFITLPILNMSSTSNSIQLWIARVPSEEKKVMPLLDYNTEIEIQFDIDFKDGTQSVPFSRKFNGDLMTDGNNILPQYPGLNGISLCSNVLFLKKVFRNYQTALFYSMDYTQFQNHQFLRCDIDKLKHKPFHYFILPTDKITKIEFDKHLSQLPLQPLLAAADEFKQDTNKDYQPESIFSEALDWFASILTKLYPNYVPIIECYCQLYDDNNLSSSEIICEMNNLDIELVTTAFEAYSMVLSHSEDTVYSAMDLEAEIDCLLNRKHQTTVIDPIYSMMIADSPATDAHN